LVEHSLGKGEVTGSIPVISSRNFEGIMKPAQIFLWSLPGFLVYAVLQVLAFRKLTGPREENAKNGLAVFALLLWYIPDTLFGITGAKEVEGLILLAGFWIAAIYLSYLLLDEFYGLKPE
jgi:hypothetical protein